MDTELQDKFWWTVVTSMTELFDIDVRAALDAVVQRRQRMVNAGSEIFYHSEPYDVAEGLAAQLGRPANPDSWKDYLSLAATISRLTSVPPFDVRHPRALEKAARSLLPQSAV